MKKLYLDHIAGTPLHPGVVESMIPYLKTHFGNPQSLHSEGQKALIAIEEAREKVAALIKAQPSEIVFTSSGSEANNFALKGLAASRRIQGMHIVVSAIEHQSVMHSLKSLERQGFTFTEVPVDEFGMVNPDDVRNAIRDDTTIVAVMLANSEVGTVEPVQEIVQICQEKDVLFHCDGVAAVGNIPVNADQLGVNTLSMAANQFYGPKGAAALFIRHGTRILPLIDGGIQENGKRAGSENVAAVVGMGRAAEIAENEIEQRNEILRPLRDQLIKGLSGKVDHVIVTGHPEKRLPYHASFCIEYVEGEAMLLNLDMQGIAASSGSACTSKALKASHVLLAMGLDHALAQGSLVFSLIEGTRKEDIDYLLDVFPPIIKRLREMSPLSPDSEEEKG